MAILFPNLDNDEVYFDALEEIQPASEIIFSEYFDVVIITSGGQIKFWNGSSYILKSLKVLVQFFFKECLAFVPHQ